MDYAEILAQTTQLLGEVSEGSSTYAASDLAKAVQWAQEQAAQHLGLTYLELVVPVVAGTDIWGDDTHHVAIPTDTIKVTRAEISDAGHPGYTITVEPPSQEITLDGMTHVVLTGTITRTGGFAEDILVTIPGSFYSAGHFDGSFDDADNLATFADLQANGHVTLAPVDDTFYIELWSDETGWATYGSYWAGFVFTGTSSETSMVVESNEATIVPSSEPYFSIDVTPASATVQFSAGDMVDPPLVLTVAITRHNGFSEQVDIEIPFMQGAWDGFVATVNGVPWNESDTMVNIAPDTFTMEFLSTKQGWSLNNWASDQGGVQLIGSSISFPGVPSNLVTVDTESVSSFAIAVTPTSSIVTTSTLAPFAHSAPMSLHVAITRDPGHSLPISITQPIFYNLSFWNYLGCYINSPIALAAESAGCWVNDALIADSQNAVYANAPDSFDVTWIGDPNGWDVYWSNLGYQPDAHMTGFDGINTVQSNVYTLALD